jgi:bcr-type benzoyl-CoA reductase subunit C
MIGSTCSYTPEEFILAAGAHPFRIFGESKGFSHADAHLQAYACSMVRGMLEDGLSGSLDFIDGVVFPHACDSIQRLSDIWRLNVKSLHFDVLLPVKLDTPLAKSYFTKVTARFKKDLEESFSVAISKNELEKAIQVMNDLRGKLMQLYTLQSKHPGFISGSDISAIVKACMVMEKQEAADLLAQVLEEAGKMKLADMPSNPKRILISGSICSHPELSRIIEEKHAAVVWDDLCSGTRYFEGLVPDDADPVEAIASRFTSRYVCPAKHLGVEFQMENLKELITEHRVDAVLFMFLKFCEPFSFDYPDIKKALEEMKIPFLMVEMDRHNGIDEQMHTRIDTMLEIL